MATDAESRAIERRIERFILGLGVAIVAGAGIGWGIRAAEAAAIGTTLCWVNFRWLQQGADRVIRLGMAQAGRQTVRVPRSVHAKFFGRLVLLLVVAYVILAWLRLPAIAFLCGLVVVVPAILLELAYEVKHGQHRWNAS